MALVTPEHDLFEGDGRVLGLRAFARGSNAPARARPQKPPFRRKLLFEALEPRLLLSADLNPLEQQAEAPLVQNFESETQVDMAAVLQQQPAARSIVFLDQSLSAYQAQLGDANVVLLDPERDGVAQITEILTGESDVAAVHIISYGEPGNVRLGSTDLNSSTLPSYADQLAAWSDALTADADILLYGCSVGADGNFLGELAALTGADVAASSDPTGSWLYGGDWDLEASTGLIEAAAETLTFGGLLDQRQSALSGDPGWVVQGPATVAMDLEELLASLPGAIFGGGEEEGPSLTDATRPVNSGTSVTGLEAQSNPVAGATVSYTHLTLPTILRV